MSRDVVVDLTVPQEQRERIVLRINGQAMATAHGFGTTERDTLLEELKAARAARSACKFMGTVLEKLDVAGELPDHNHKTEKAKRADFADGLRAGLAGETVPYPGAEAAFVPPVPPRHTPSYRRGYDLGDAVRRAVKMGSEEP